MLRNSFILLLAYILQTTVLRWTVFKPDTFLVLFVLFAAEKDIFRSVALGFGLGVLLDALSGFSFYNTFLYTSLGALFGIMPRDVFRDYYSLTLIDLILGFVFLHLAYGGLTLLVGHKFLIIPWYLLPVVFLLDVLIYFLLKDILRSRASEHARH